MKLKEYRIPAEPVVVEESDEDRVKISQRLRELVARAAESIGKPPGNVVVCPSYLEIGIAGGDDGAVYRGIRTS